MSQLDQDAPPEGELLSMPGDGGVSAVVAELAMVEPVRLPKPPPRGSEEMAAAQPPHLARSSAPPRARASKRDPAQDAEVLAALARGDRRAALAELMRVHGVAVYRFVRGMVGDGDLADDIHQQVFVQAHRDFDAFEGRADIGGWLYGIARHRCLDALRSRQRWADRHPSDAVDDHVDGAVPVDACLDEKRMIAALGQCLDSLPPATRMTVLMRFQEGFSFDEMAEICRERAGTLQQRVARVLPVLRRCIEGRMERRQ